MKSIRSTLLLGILTIFFFGIIILSLVSYEDATHEIEEIFDAQLATSARVLQGLVSKDISKGQLDQISRSLVFTLPNMDEHDEEASPFGHTYENKLIFQLWDQNHELILRSFAAPLDPLSKFERGYSNTQNAEFSWRIFTMYDEDKRTWLFVAEREDVRGELVNEITLKLIAPMIIGLPLLAVMIYFLIGRGLSPLTKVVSSIHRRNPLHLEPIKKDSIPSEIEPLITALNELMHQIHMALEREKRFTEDAAHELRTPLSVLKIHAQNALNQTDPIKKIQSLNKLILGVDRSTRLVEQLLNLERLEHGMSTLEKKSLNLRELVRQELGEIAPLAIQRNQQLSLDIEGGDFMIRGNEIGLMLLVRNLIHNAIQHSPTAGRIEATLKEETEGISLEIADSGPGVPRELRDRILDRFYRVQPGTKSGAGLGLSIVQCVAESHGARLSIDNKPERQGLCVVVTFPRENTSVSPMHIETKSGYGSHDSNEYAQRA